MGLKKGLLSDSGGYSLSYNLPYWFIKFINKHPMINISETAKNRLSIIEFYYQVRSVSVVCRTFQISRKTFYKWLRRYEESGKRLFSLEDKPKTPKTKRKTTLDFNTELKIKHPREKYIKLGKVKLQKLFKKEHNQYISQHHIAYVIQKYNLYYDPNKTKRIRSKKDKRKGEKKIRINEINPNNYLSF